MWCSCHHFPVSEKVKMLVPVMSDSLSSHGLGSARVLCHWDSPGNNTGGGCHVFLQEIFLTHGSNSGFLHCRQILYCLSHQGGPIKPCFTKWKKIIYCPDKWWLVNQPFSASPPPPGFILPTLKCYLFNQTLIFFLVKSLWYDSTELNKTH